MRICKQSYAIIWAAWVLTAVACAPASRAADMAIKSAPMQAREPDPWKVDVTLYGWLPSLNGTSTVKGHRANIDFNFFTDIDNVIHRKIPEQLFGIMAAFEARIALIDRLQHADPPHSPRLLRPRHERPRDRRAAKQLDELAPPCMSRKEHCEG